MSTNTAGERSGDKQKIPSPKDFVEDWKSGDAHKEIFNAEELANSVSHGIGLGLSIAGLALLMTIGFLHGEAVHVISAAIYGSSLCLLFMASTLYHSMMRPGPKRALRVLDHSAIFLLIAGTYTPYTLIALPAPAGLWVFGIVWSLAVVGVTYKLFFFGRLPGMSLGLYLGMGWTIVFAFKPLLESMEMGGVVLLFVGGLFYTVGVVFYVWEKLLFNHAIWHLFVLSGAVCHYLSILFYVYWPLG